MPDILLLLLLLKAGWDGVGDWGGWREWLELNGGDIEIIYATVPSVPSSTLFIFNCTNED
jgi:hypothetical protein